MRRLLAAAIVVVATFAACTQDFDQFRIVDSDASAGSGGASGASGSGGSAGLDASEEGSAGIAGQAPDAGDAGPDGGCPPGQKACPAGCVDETDPATGCATTSCDPCNVPNATAACDSSGECAIGQCNAGYSDCSGGAGDGCETQTDGDPDHCGGCGTQCVLANATPGCTGGSCTIAVCATGYTDCDGDPATGCEVNTGSDPTACGSCSNDCTAQGGTWTCENGSCKVSTCPSGTSECDQDPNTVCETDVNQSLVHCGFCNNPCIPPNATGKCNAGVCAIEKCDPGFADCDNNPQNGCEADLSKSTQHCGACNRGCSTANTTSASCQGGICVSSCNPGYGNCSQPVAPIADDGCESHLLTDLSACGACGRACSLANVSAASCVGGKCTPSCNPGFGNCSEPLAPSADDGCETNVAGDAQNCGACGRTCSTLNVQGAPSCSAGVCASSCKTGFGNCSLPPAPAFDDGCETNVGSDPDNCGACNRACAGGNVVQKLCTGGLCTSTCGPGFANCGQPAAPAPDDGCEANLNTNPAHCGACNRACNSVHVSTLSCAAGVCSSSCTAGFGNCSQPSAPAADDGCETDTANNLAHCGGCGRACSTTGVSAVACSGGLCTSSCNTGLGNCQQPAAPSADDGCETNITNHPAHCGACGRACGEQNVAALSCASGTCNSYCVIGYANCSQPAAPGADDGCELDAKNTDTQCGSCTNSCAAQNGMVCGDGSIPDSTCGCNANSDCRTNGDSGGDCTSSGVCECPGGIGADETCRPGEVCVHVSFGNYDCSCNGGGNCSSSQVCCEDGGCTNLSTSASNCGACGRTCPPSFVCSGGACACSTNASCGGGGIGTCSSGLCVCGGKTCASGERCLPGNVCG